MAKTKKNKKLSTLLVVTLLAAVAIGGMLAYLQDESKAMTNVMELGNVDIEQIEAFEANAPLYPAIGALTEDGDGLWTNSNVVEKRVTVENKGKSDAYVRTWFAFEYGDESSFEYVKANVNDTNWKWQWLDGTTEVAGMECKIAVATYVTPLVAKNTTEESLMQVALLNTATNESIKIYGDQYKVFVISQAVQTEGFEATDDKIAAEVALEEAFGEVKGENNPWKNIIYSGTKDALETALKEGGEVNLSDNIGVEDLWVKSGATINGDGNKLIRETASGNPLTISTTEPVVFDNVNFESTKGSAVLATRKEGSNITVKNSTFNNLASPSTGNVGVQIYAKDVIITFEDCTFKNMPVITNSSYAGSVKIEFNNCKFIWNGNNCSGMLQLANNIVADVDFNNCKYEYNNTPESTRTYSFVGTGTSVGEGTTIDFNGFEMVGTGAEGKIWSIVAKGGVKTGNNVTVAKNGTCTYTFNGETVDFDTYLFR